VLSRTGKPIGTWAEPLGGNVEQLITSPDGTEWAWNVYSGMDKTGREYGQVNVSGLGSQYGPIPWVAPVGFSDAAPAWTSAGIILCAFRRTRVARRTLAPAALHSLSIHNRSTEQSVQRNEQYLDADSQDTIGWLSDDGHSVVINGVVYSESSRWSRSISYNGEPRLRSAPTGTMLPSIESTKRHLQWRHSQGQHRDGDRATSKPHRFAQSECLGSWNDNEFVALASNQSIWLYTCKSGGE